LILIFVLISSHATLRTTPESGRPKKRTLGCAVEGKGRGWSEEWGEREDLLGNLEKR
jgi:hypothetical protein